MELNAVVTKTPAYPAGTDGHVCVFDRSGSGRIDLEIMTEKGWKKLTDSIDDEMIDHEGPDGAIIPINLIPGEKIRFVNVGFTSVQVEYRTFTK